MAQVGTPDQQEKKMYFVVPWEIRHQTLYTLREQLPSGGRSRHTMGHTLRFAPQSLKLNVNN
jgi:hypothetical protein